MANSSPTRRQSHHWGSPQRFTIEDIIGEDRNSEARHRYLLETARREHERIREDAERVYREQLQREERQRLLEERRKEEERIRLEEQLAAERARLNALKAKKIEIPPPLPDPEPPAAPKVNGNAIESSHTTSQEQQATTQRSPKPRAASPAAQPSHQAVPNGLSQPSEQAKPASPASDAPQPNGVKTSAETLSPPSAAVAGPDRYTEIHKNLKVLRKSMTEQATSNKALKAKMGDMRREIRKCVGQLTVSAGTAGGNTGQRNKIISLLREAMANEVQSLMMDPSIFVLEPRQPVEGAVHNEPTLPSLFLYLLNIFAKAAISQFINEAGARPETADPVGVCVVSVLSEPDLLWRGQSMIDILLAKFRIVCPVLFGYRGSEKTHQGRERLGWWKDGGQYVTEQVHMDRMTGLGAGFAAISLRKFSPTMTKKNPFPPRNYWTAMARIVNTPAEEISNTQCVVLKAMIHNYEQKFIDFYGNAAIAALRVALVDFPARAPEKSAAVNSLQVLAQLLRKDTGLVLG
ncbi:hypothetical protein VTK26DRAFT_8971 [Humicola hyalothermophila]